MTPDTDASARAHALFDPIADRYVQRPDVDIGVMFGAEGLRVRNKVFAFVGHLGGLVVKLPEARVTELAEQGVAERMVMRSRPMREWATVGVAAGEARWEELVAEEFGFLDDITP
ncbi:MAG TPA: hypothetical protein VEX12_01610 [Microbacterium sp.]|nr:hypothetical protein [Microbacterium sp.]